MRAQNSLEHDRVTWQLDIGVQLFDSVAVTFLTLGKKCHGIRWHLNQ